MELRFPWKVIKQVLVIAMFTGIPQVMVLRALKALQLIPLNLPK